VYGGQRLLAAVLVSRPHRSTSSAQRAAAPTPASVLSTSQAVAATTAKPHSHYGPTIRVYVRSASAVVLQFAAKLTCNHAR